MELTPLLSDSFAICFGIPMHRASKERELRCYEPEPRELISHDRERAALDIPFTARLERPCCAAPAYGAFALRIRPKASRLQSFLKLLFGGFLACSTEFTCSILHDLRRATTIIKIALGGCMSHDI